MRKYKAGRGEKVVQEKLTWPTNQHHIDSREHCLKGGNAIHLTNNSPADCVGILLTLIQWKHYPAFEQLEQYKHCC